MNIGFYILNINNDNAQQLACLNRLCELRPYDNIVLFNSVFNYIDTDPKYYTLHISQAKYFNGLLFIFDIKSALLTKNFPSPKKQFLFVEDMDWGKETRFPYKFWHNIYMDENIELISTTEETDELCKICWKDPIANIENYNPEEVNNVLQKL